MARRAFQVLAGLAVVLATTGQAHAAEPVLAGDACDFVSSEWDGGGHYRVVVRGGPIAAAEVRAVRGVDADLAAVTLTCSVRTPDQPYSSPAADEVSASGTGVAVVPPTELAYYDPGETGDFAVCTEVAATTQDGTTYRYYWDTWGNEFSTDPATPCESTSCPLEECGSVVQDVWREAFGAVGGVWREVDPVLCQALQELPDQPGQVETGDDGDLYVNGEWFWDCPPYAT